MLLAALAGATVTALLFGGIWFFLEPGQWPLLGAFVAFFVSLAHIIFLGIPTIQMLRKFRLLNWASVLISGFLWGFISYAAFLYVTSPSGKYGDVEWHDGMMQVMVSNGVITSAGWHLRILGAVEVGLIGIFVSAVFFAVLSLRRSTQVSARRSTSRDSA